MADVREIQRRVRTGCLTCRKRHMKCDERKPQCKHCEIAKRACVFETFTSNLHRKEIGSASKPFQFSADHIWLETPSRVRFIHQVNTQGPTSSSCAVISDSSTSQSSPAASSPSSARPDTPMIADPAQYFRMDHDVVPAHYSTAPSYAGTRGGRLRMDDPIESFRHRRRSGSSIYKRGPPEPLKDPKEARLLQHYIDNLAHWLDINDPNRHFATFVPYLALSCPILLHAILAFAASHLSRSDTAYDAITAIEYHDACVKGLIPALENPSTALDNVLPSSTVILRMHEMLSYEADHQRHLRGCSSLFNHNRTNIEFRALKRTAFWTYVREEMMVALANRSPTNIRTSSWKQDIVWEGDHDYVRTNQITWLAAEVVNFCFGEDAENDAPKWSYLQKEIDHWKRTLPETFQPLYIMEGNGPFPEISYLSSWHVVGMQFYLLIKVLLALHNPQQPKGLEFLNFARATEAEILEHTRHLCGIISTLGNKHSGALVNAVQPLVVCGKSLRTHEEQDELTRILRRIEVTTAWSTVQAVQALHETWRTAYSQR